MPVAPVAPGVLITGNDVPSIGSASFAVRRASWSAPPPGPQGTMISMGRDGYFSCAGAIDATSAAATAAAMPMTPLSDVMSILLSDACDRAVWLSLHIFGAQASKCPTPSRAQATRAANGLGRSSRALEVSGTLNVPEATG